jgi:hypothetical protein
MGAPGHQQHSRFLALPGGHRRLGSKKAYSQPAINTRPFQGSALDGAERGAIGSHLSEMRVRACFQATFLALGDLSFTPGGQPIDQFGPSGNSPHSRPLPPRWADLSAPAAKLSFY